MLTAKYKLIKDEESIFVVTENGGIAEIREVEELEEGDNRKSVSEYYYLSFDQKDVSSKYGIWKKLNEGKIECYDWTTPYDNPAHITHALNWLCFGDYIFIEDENIWPDLDIYNYSYFTN